MDMNWSRWFHCESSFGLLLVPSQPGVFALAEEVVQAADPQSRRMLAVFEVAEADDLSRAMSRLFAAGSPWREKLAQARCYVRYAVAPSIADRRTAAAALKNWLTTQREVASQIFESRPPAAGEQKTFEKAPMTAEPTVTAAVGGTGEVRIERRAARLQHEGEMKTVAERAVDRVTHGIKLAKAVSAGS
jgi:acyl-CoA reductase-like NAD-dependent aldehyde dehydrogenase